MDGKRAVLKSWGVLLGVPVCFLCAYFYPSIPVIAGLQTCAVRGFLGIPCPGCGLTTSLTLLTHGRLGPCIYAHPLGLVIAAWLAYIFFREIFHAFTGRELPALLRQGQRDMILAMFLFALFFHWAAKVLLT